MARKLTLDGEGLLCACFIGQMRQEGNGSEMNGAQSIALPSGS
jgi:hypothetical protein